MLDDGPSVPLVTVLASMDLNLREIRQKLDAKAEDTRVAELERRFYALELTSVSQDAVTAELRSLSKSRARTWMTVCLAATAQIVTVAIFFATQHHS